MCLLVSYSYDTLTCTPVINFEHFLFLSCLMLICLLAQLELKTVKENYFLTPTKAIKELNA